MVAGATADAAVVGATVVAPSSPGSVAGGPASVGGTVGGVVDGGATSSGADRLGSSAAWTMIRFLAE